MDYFTEDSMPYMGRTGIDNANAFSANWRQKGEHHISPEHGRYDDMFRAFAVYINGVKSNPYTYEYEKKLHKVLLKACGEEI